MKKIMICLLGLGAVLLSCEKENGETKDKNEIAFEEMPIENRTPHGWKHFGWDADGNGNCDVPGTTCKGYEYVDHGHDLETFVRDPEVWEVEEVMHTFISDHKPQLTEYIDPTLLDGVLNHELMLEKTGNMDSDGETVYLLFSNHEGDIIRALPFMQVY